MGITEYMNKDTAGWTGVLKARFSDFVVNEVGLNAQVVEFVAEDADVGIEAIAKLEEVSLYITLTTSTQRHIHTLSLCSKP